MATVERPRSVADGVALFPARTPTLPPATHTNSYALGTRDVLLVEPATPFEDERRAWLDWARGLASQGRHLVAIFATHHHIDHISGARFLAAELDLPLWMHGANLDWIDDIPVTRQLTDDELIELDGPQPMAWRCLHTPGHAPGHLCLYESHTGTAIVGDMVASVGTILIDPSDGDLSEYLRQLARLERLGAEVALPAHGDPITDPGSHFRHYIQHRLMREEKVVSALNQATEPASVTSLLPGAYSDTPRELWPLAARSLESHLVKLENDGAATCNDSGLWTRFTP